MEYFLRQFVAQTKVPVNYFVVAIFGAYVIIFFFFFLFAFIKLLSGEFINKYLIFLPPFFASSSRNGVSKEFSILYSINRYVYCHHTPQQVNEAKEN